MDAQTFLDNFATIADAPGGVQRLRDLVLDLAFAGQLTEAFASDEPVDALLDRLATRSAEAMRSAKGSRTAGTPPEATIPSAWRWVEFANVAHIASNLVQPSEHPDEIHVAPDNIEKFTGRLLPCRTIREDAVISAKHRFFPGQILYSKIRPALSKSVVVDFAGLCSADMYPINPWIDRRYLHRQMLSPRFVRGIVNDDNRLAMPKVNQRQLNRSWVAVAPLPEQERVVAKVDELMRLIDDLEGRQQRRRRATTRFRSSALHALTEAESPENLRLAWQRVESNWPAITAASNSIGELRQTILQLAFEGKLTGAGAHGKPRSESAPPILDGPFPIPGHWRWARFDEVADSRLGRMLDKAKNTGPLRPYLRNANVQWFRFDLSDVHELRLEDADLETHSLRAGDLVICEGGEPGRLAVCDDTVSGMVFQKALHRARPSGEVDVWYLAYLLRCHAGSGYLSTFFTGATIKHLTGKALGTVPVPVPPIDEQRQIVARIEELTAACDQLQATTSRCAAIQAAAAAGLARAT